MSTKFYQMLKRFMWPRYREEGPPSYIDSFFFDKECIDSEGQIREPIRSVLNLVTLGHRPVTTISILSVLVENQNRPMYGAQLGKELEDRFDLPKGWFTKTRYYDNRISKLLKVLCRLGILKETEFVESLTKRRHIGYHIQEDNYAATRERIMNFMQGGTLSIFDLTSPRSTASETEQTEMIKRCPDCQALTTSLHAKFCELCGNLLMIVCPECKREGSLEYDYCLYCGKKLVQ